jgi:hypothetical protein
MVRENNLKLPELIEVIFATFQAKTTTTQAGQRI